MQAEIVTAANILVGSTKVYGMFLVKEQENFPAPLLSFEFGGSSMTMQLPNVVGSAVLTSTMVDDLSSLRGRQAEVIVISVACVLFLSFA